MDWDGWKHKSIAFLREKGVNIGSIEVEDSVGDEVIARHYFPQVVVRNVYQFEDTT